MDFRGMSHHLSALAADPALLTPLDDLALPEQTAHALQATNVLDQLLFRFTADLDKRGVAQTCGAESTAELLQSSGLVAPAAAHRDVRVGRALPDAENDELGEKLAGALDSWTTPVPEPDGSPDPRTRAQLRAEASTACWIRSSPNKTDPPAAASNLT